MDIDSITGYVKRHSDSYVSLRGMRSMIGPFIFLVTFPLIGAIVARKLIVATIMVSTVICYTIFVNILNRRLTSVSYYQRFLFSGIFSSFGSLLFLMLAYWIIEVGIPEKSTQIAYSIILGIAWILAVLLIFAFKIINIKKGVYKRLNSGKVSPGLAIASSGGAVLGISLAKLASKWMTQEVAINVVIVLSYIVAVFAALGIPHFMISYFVKKYSIPGESLPVVRPKMTRAKRIAIKIVIAFVLLLTFMVVGGVLVNKGILK